MAFPTTPTNGQVATVNGITYSYASATNSWTRASSTLLSISNLIVLSNTTTGNLNSTNNVTGAIANFSGNIFGLGVAATTYYGQINLGTTSVSLNRTSAAQIFTGVGIDGTAGTATVAVGSQITANTSAGTAYLTFVNSTSANSALNTTTSLTFNPSTGNVTAFGYSGNHWGAGAFTTANISTSLQPTANLTVNSGSSTAYWGTTWTGRLTANTATISAGTANAAVITGNVYAAGWLIPFTSNASYNIGTSTSWWGTIYGKATQAQYADLAENYLSDDDYIPGTVVIFGGDNEVTTTVVSHDTRVAGVVSTDPAYLMNAINGNVAVALTGRVPCFVRGPVEKGTVLVTSDIPGVAEALDNSMYSPGCVIGKSLEHITDSNIKTIEVAVGRF